MYKIQWNLWMNKLISKFYKIAGHYRWIAPFFHYKRCIFVSCYLFHLYSILSDISVATPTTFSGCLAWSITFHPVTLNLFVFVAEMGLLKAACSWVLFFNPSSYCVPFDGWAQSTYIQSDYWYRRLSRAISSFLSAQYLSHFSSLLSLPAILAWRFSMLFLHFLFLICLCLSSGVLLCGYR